MARVLVVEDERDLADGLRDNLELEGHNARAVHTGEDALAITDEWRPDLIILDIMLPDIDGYEILRRLRHDELETPVLMLTARGEEADKVRGFRLGADDYVTKPFGLLELLARVEAVLRRTALARGETEQKGFQLGTLVVDPGARLATRENEPVELAPKEFDLLLTLHHHAGEAVSRQHLLREAWGHRGMVNSRTVDTHIAELRRKIEPDPERPRYIHTVRKYGYRLTP